MATEFALVLPLAETSPLEAGLSSEEALTVKILHFSFLCLRLGRNNFLSDVFKPVFTIMRALQNTEACLQNPSTVLQTY